VHDNDSIYSRELDSALTSIGLQVLKTPFRAPQAHAFYERLIGTIRRECLKLPDSGQRKALAETSS